MTAEEFKARFKKEDKSEDNSSYFKCIALITISMFYGYKYGIQGKTLPLVIFASLFICLGVYGVWRTRNRHVIKEIKSPGTIQRKVEILEGFADTFEKRRLSKRDGIYMIDAISAYIHAYIDDEKIFIYVNGPTSSLQLYAANSHPMLEKAHKHFLENL